MTSPHRKKARKESEASSACRKMSQGSVEASPSSQPMTLERRLKKRESDRKCQRVSRERTKSRITYLENLVEKLSQADDSGKVASLLDNVSRLQEERDSLAAKIKSIESILFPAQRPMAAESTKLQSTVSSLPEVPSSGFSPVQDMSTAASAHRTTSEALKDSPVEGAPQSFADQDMASRDLGNVSEASRDLIMHPTFSSHGIGNAQYMPLFPPLFKLVKEFLPHMVQRNHGHIVTIASIASFASVANNASYSATKAGALAFHEGLAQELKARYGANKVRTT